MLHYSQPDGVPCDLTGVCKYCGKPLSDPNSILRGYGDVCFEKHRKRHIRRIITERGVTDGSNRTADDIGSESAGDSGCKSAAGWDSYKNR